MVKFHGKCLNCGQEIGIEDDSENYDIPLEYYCIKCGKLVLAQSIKKEK